MKNRYLLGGSFEGELSMAVLRMQSASEAHKPCFVVSDAITGRFFQCAGGAGRDVRLEVPWGLQANVGVGIEEICVFFHVRGSRDDSPLSQTFSYDFEQVRITGCEFRRASDVAKFCKELALEILRLPPSALLEIEEFLQDDPEQRGLPSAFAGVLSGIEAGRRKMG